MFSVSKRGVLRGLHFSKHTQRAGQAGAVLHGEVFDVAVDIRVAAPRSDRGFTCTLFGQNHRQFYIPAGFATASGVPAEPRSLTTMQRH